MSTAPVQRPELRIRPITQRDLGAVLEIERACFSTPWRLSTFESLLHRTDTDLVGAERGERLVGYAVCWTIVDQAELGNVAVSPFNRGGGIGRLLVEEALARAAARGAGECFLEVRQSNTVAQELYRKLGFEVIGRRPRYYSLPTEDALVMRIRL